MEGFYSISNRFSGGRLSGPYGTSQRREARRVARNKKISGKMIRTIAMILLYVFPNISLKYYGVIITWGLKENWGVCTLSLRDLS